MKINVLFMTFVIISALAFLFVSDRAESLDITKITQGTVKAVKADCIEILDDQNGNKVQIVINSNTVYDNVQKLKDLKAGDKIQIEYQEEHNKNIATTITKLEIENEDSI